MSFDLYMGILDRYKMSKDERYAYEAFCGLKARSKKQKLPPPTFDARQFMGWWLFNLKSFTGTIPTCGRIDHKKGYSFENIMMQDMAENSRENVLRTKLHIRERFRTNNQIVISCKKSNEDIAIINSIRETAKIFGVSQRLIQFLIRKKIKKSNKINFNLRSLK